LWAVLLPPIPPLLVAIVVFFTRRAKEREGVSRSRLR
jgi:ABC-2 type transport system permease protein